MGMALVSINCPVCKALNEYEMPEGQSQCMCRTCRAVFTIALECRVIPADKFYRDPAWLATEYIEMGRTMQDIASEFSVSPMTICHWLRRHDIKTRSRGRRRFI